MSRTRSSLGGQLGAGLVMVILVVGSPICPCAGPEEQAHEGAGGMRACCSGDVPKPQPAQHHPACSHCESQDAKTPKAQQLDRCTRDSWSPEISLETAALISRPERTQPRVAGCDLSPPSSSGRILTQLCTLLI